MDNNEILDFGLNDDHDKIKIELTTTNRFILFFVLSLGIYGAWWMYKQWVFFRDDERLDIWPAARAIFGIFFIHTLFEKIQGMAQARGYTDTYNSGLLFIGFIAFSLMGRLPDPFSFLSFIGFLIYLQPNSAFNYAIENSEDYRAVYSSNLSTRQIVLVVVGILLWVLVIAGVVLPEEGY